MIRVTYMGQMLNQGTRMHEYRQKIEHVIKIKVKEQCNVSFKVFFFWLGTQVNCVHSSITVTEEGLSSYSDYRK